MYTKSDIKCDSRDFYNNKYSVVLKDKGSSLQMVESNKRNQEIANKAPFNLVLLNNRTLTQKISRIE